MYVVPDHLRGEHLYVIAPIFNPIRWKSRWKLYARFAKAMVDSGARLVTVEAAFGDRAHALRAVAPHGDGHLYIPVRLRDEVWVKESLANVALHHLSVQQPDWRHAALVDADVSFARTNWVGDTLHALQHYAWVQLFSDAIDLGPSSEPLQAHKSFMWCHVQGEPAPPGGYWRGKPGTSTRPHLWHSGYAHAFRRSTIDQLGGLIDWAIMGSADRLMCMALVGRVDECVDADGMSSGYVRSLQEWQARAERHVRRNVGYVSGLLLHGWHGAKKDRGYQTRREKLARHRYDPSIDLKRDAQGLIQLVDRGDERSIAVRDDIRAFLRARNEDSSDAA